MLDLEPFPTVTEAVVHRPIVGSSLSLNCRPPRSYPSGNIYWGISRAQSNQLKAIDNSARVLLSYEGNNCVDVLEMIGVQIDPVMFGCHYE